MILAPGDPPSAGQYWAFWHMVGLIDQRRFSPGDGVRCYRLEMAADCAALGWTPRDVHERARDLRRAGIAEGISQRRAERARVARSLAAFAAGTHDPTNVVRLADRRG